MASPSDSPTATTGKSSRSAKAAVRSRAAVAGRLSRHHPLRLRCRPCRAAGRLHAAVNLRRPATHRIPAADPLRPFQVASLLRLPAVNRRHLFPSATHRTRHNRQCRPADHPLRRLRHSLLHLNLRRRRRLRHSSPTSRQRLFRPVGPALATRRCSSPRCQKCGSTTF